MIFALLMAVTKSSTDFSPTSRPIQPSGMPSSTVAWPTSASTENFEPVTKS